LDILDVAGNIIVSKNKSVTNGTLTQNIEFDYNNVDLSNYSILNIRLYTTSGIGISFAGLSNVNNSFVTSYNGYNSSYLSKGGTVWEFTNNYVPNISIYVLGVDLKMSNGIEYSNIVDIKNNLINIRNTTGWSFPNELFISDNQISFVPVSINDTSGIITNSFTPSGGIYVTINLNIASSISNPTSRPSLTLFNPLNDTWVTTLVEELNYGDNIIRFDPDYYAVYYNLSSFKLVIALAADPSSTGTITITDFIVYQSKIDALNIYGNKLDDTILNIDNKLTSLNTSIDQLVSKSPDLTVTSPSGYKYFIQVNDDGSMSLAKQIPSKALFIGNSLLYGFTTFGMCASDSSHDYYHYVNNKILSLNSNYTVTKHEGYTWEGYTTLSEQNEWLNTVLLPLLSNDLDLIIIQLGDNINDAAKLAVFEQGTINFLKFIRQNCPKARTVWVGEWYSSSEKQSFIASACIKTGSFFIDISDINITENQSAIGNTVTMDNGSTYTVTQAGVASHPGNTGMLKIANRICYKLGLTNSET
jgi:hypothetical protein